MKIKKWNVALYVAVFALIIFGNQAVKLVTDYYWFQEVGFIPMFMKSVMAQGILWSVSTLLTAGIFLLNCQVARRLSKRPFIVIGPDVTVDSPLPLPQILEMKPLLRALLFGFIALDTFLAANWS